MIYGDVELTKKKLLDLAEILGAVEIKAGDREFAKLRLHCMAYSAGVYGCNGCILKDQNGKFYVINDRTPGLWIYGA